MKRFSLHILGLITGTLLIMWILDIAYTEVYRQNVRTKFQYLRSLQGQSIDYVFLGSSRVQNNINPILIEEKTNQSCINLGFQASKLSDIYTILQLLKNYDIKTKKVFIQVDYIFNLNAHSNIMTYEVMPFIRDNDVTKNNFNYMDNFEALYYVPFYRYCVYDYKIGFREFIMNLSGKETNITKFNGYSPLYGIASKNASTQIPKTIWDRNPSMDSIFLYCKRNHIEPVYFCAPFTKTTPNIANFMQQLQSKIPQLKDYSQIVDDHKLFVNGNHLNHQGATFFTNYIIEDLKLNE